MAKLILWRRRGVCMPSDCLVREGSPVHEHYLTHQDVDLFGPGVCSGCGKYGFHPACEARAVERVRAFDEAKRRLLEQHALHGTYGIVGAASRQSYDCALAALSAYLERPLDGNPEHAVEGAGWWFIAEGWIGMLGFIVEKEGATIYPLVSGLAGRYRLPNASADWCAIVAYVNGRVEAVERSTNT
ncbi:hypothetical protein [Massilia aquatica]|uniref:Uncharacterized protein n=1 Tax=Massilia aquatica TaxID=2609000 RepID=A0ABX0M995_9BURK|nr:hypothetical protein [Massilia aquatica]NHZ43738.1 hypothetical protein [Massilia aquatica]